MSQLDHCWVTFTPTTRRTQGEAAVVIAYDDSDGFYDHGLRELMEHERF